MDEFSGLDRTRHAPRLNDIELAVDVVGDTVRRFHIEKAIARLYDAPVMQTRLDTEVDLAQFLMRTTIRHLPTGLAERRR